MKATDQIGQNMHRVSLGRNLTQEQVAMEANLDLSYVSDIEFGKRNLTLVSIIKLSRALSCLVVDLLDGMDNVDVGDGFPPFSWTHS